MVIRNRMVFVIITGLVFLTIALLLSRSASREAARIVDARADMSFVDLGGVEDWRVDGDAGLYVLGRNHRWHYAEFMAPCIGSSKPEHIEFVITPTDTADRFTAVITGDQKCIISSFRQSDGPSQPARR